MLHRNGTRREEPGVDISPKDRHHFPMNCKAAFAILALLSSPLLTHCSTSTALTAPASTQLDDTTYQTFDGDRFGYRKWLPKTEPQMVIIGVHGINGASLDYKPLATEVLKSLPHTAVYAAETRGQGNDPIKSRRGHIHHREEWFRDLLTFSHLIRKQHPKAKIVWCGESMGSLIVLHSHTYALATQQKSCDALILSSPITEIRGDFPRWKERLAHGLAAIFPTARISLETLSGNHSAKVTKDSIHQEQANQNSYHVKRQTFRLLSTLGKMIRSAKDAGQQIQIPTLILHGGKDIFSEAQDVEAFAKAIPKAPVRQYYPESYHLLFYDHQSETVIRDITDWLGQIR